MDPSISVLQFCAINPGNHLPSMYPIVCVEELMCSLFCHLHCKCSYTLSELSAQVHNVKCKDLSSIWTISAIIIAYNRYVFNLSYQSKYAI